MTSGLQLGPCMMPIIEGEYQRTQIPLFLCFLSNSDITTQGAATTTLKGRIISIDPVNPASGPIATTAKVGIIMTLHTAPTGGADQHRPGKIHVNANSTYTTHGCRLPHQSYPQPSTHQTMSVGWDHSNHSPLLTLTEGITTSRSSRLLVVYILDSPTFPVANLPF